MKSRLKTGMRDTLEGKRVIFESPDYLALPTVPGISEKVLQM